MLNGIADAPEGLARARLGLLPLGTVNVFACEMSIPTRLEAAWETIRRGKETRMDLPIVEYDAEGARQRRYFAQLAGAGLDARAIELVHWPLKKQIGPLAYIVAGLKALLGEQSKITAAGGGHSATGELVLIGNGMTFMADATKCSREPTCGTDAWRHVYSRESPWRTLARCGPSLLLRKRLPAAAVKAFQSESLTLSSPSRTPLEADGELIGHLPATFSIQRSALRVIVP